MQKENQDRRVTWKPSKDDDEIGEIMIKNGAIYLATWRS